MKEDKTVDEKNRQGTVVHRFDRNFNGKSRDFSFLGEGALGGKAGGLAFIKEHIQVANNEWSQEFQTPSITVDIPGMLVITTYYFDRFMQQNNLYDIALSDESDDRIAAHFLQAELPTDLLGDLRSFITHTHSPLAIRSSSLLEDSLESPFAGVYCTKMISNNQPDIDTRFRKLMEAIKFVYASTFFTDAKSYIRTTPHAIENEKMAVIIQEVVGLRHNHQFYPNISGVARSYNFYPTGMAEAKDGVVHLALGLGKTIVDGGISWTYSPNFPEVSPPFNSINDLLKQSQIDFWAVNMSANPPYDPLKETEYMKKLNLSEAEYDNTLRFIASTYDYQNDRVIMGTSAQGPRILNFAPILQTDMLPINRLIQSVLKKCEEIFNGWVEIEFAITIDPMKKNKLFFGLLQVRPMAISNETVELDSSGWNRETVLTASDYAMGNAAMDDLRDIVYIEPDGFSFKNSRAVAEEISVINRTMVQQHIPYVLAGFGRWGSSDPWLGIPVNWSQISGAKVILESQTPGMAIDFSQGSHFFHNMINLGILYFSVPFNSTYPLDWEWLARQEVVSKGHFTRHVKLSSPLTVKVDGRNRKGVILK